MTEVGSRKTGMRGSGETEYRRTFKAAQPYAGACALQDT